MSVPSNLPMPSSSTVQRRSQRSWRTVKRMRPPVGVGDGPVHALHRVPQPRQAGHERQPAAFAADARDDREGFENLGFLHEIALVAGVFHDLAPAFGVDSEGVVESLFVVVVVETFVHDERILFIGHLFDDPAVVSKPGDSFQTFGVDVHVVGDQRGLREEALSVAAHRFVVPAAHSGPSGVAYEAVFAEIFALGHPVAEQSVARRMDLGELAVGIGRKVVVVEYVGQLPRPVPSGP